MIAVTYGAKPGFRPPPRASIIGLWLILAALGMLFVSSMWLYILMRLHVFGRTTNEPIQMPLLAWGSTAVLFAGSFTAHRAVAAIRLERLAICLKYLYITSALAILFLIVQSPCMAQVLAEHRRLRDAAQINKAPGEFAPVSLYGFVFILILLHALHVLGGIIALAVVTWQRPPPKIRSRKLHGHPVRRPLLAFPGHRLARDVHDVHGDGVTHPKRLDHDPLNPKAPGPSGCVTLAQKNFPLPWYSGGGLGWGSNADWPTKPPPLPSPGVPGEGKDVVAECVTYPDRRVDLIDSLPVPGAPAKLAPFLPRKNHDR